jgi:glycosyltransferase involved in cell wall biosynthesis
MLRKEISTNSKPGEFRACPSQCDMLVIENRQMPSNQNVELSGPAIPEVSIVMPCLNEADTLEVCITKANRALADSSIDAEIIVADNGSHDGSPEIAQRLSARVVHVEPKGYGHALMAGIGAARGRFIIMGDADDSYDFGEIPTFVGKLREGFDLVQGCRFPSGGGHIESGAMPFLHRWVGNPLLSLLVRRMFGGGVKDIYCGLRGFTREHYQRLDQRCTGMEFATEMIVRSTMTGAKIAQIPITLHPDGRRSHARHLKTFRDGWRTLRFFLLYSPRWLFLIPGIALVLTGLIGYGLAMPGITIAGLTFDAHTLLFASLAILCGFQSIVFAILSKTFAINEGLMPPDPRMDRFYELMNLERGLALGILAILFGVLLLLGAVEQWKAAGFGRLEYSHTMRWVVPGVTLAAVGFQTVLSGFFASILGMHRRN